MEVARWTGREAAALHLARRMSVRAYAARLGVTVATVSNWHSRAEHARLRTATQQLLDIDLAQASADVRERFRAILAGESADVRRPRSGREAHSLASSAPPIVVPQRRLSPDRIHGRATLLRDVDAFLDDGDGVRHQRQAGVVVLHGIGGIGKTTVALEIAHRALARGVTTWWVPADNADSMRAALYAVAFSAGAQDDDFDHAHPADVLWRCLNGLQRPWLLVVDNADDPTALGGEGRAVAHGVGWLRPPTHRQGTVVVTSRDGRVEQWASWVQLRHVPTLDPDSGADMLLDLAPDAGERGHARTLAVALGGLPLALELAGRYLASTAIDPLPPADRAVSFAAYRNSLDRRLVELQMSEHGPDNTGENRRALSTTWEMSVDLLARQGHDLARPLLRLIACFAAAPLPYQPVIRPEILQRSPLFPNATPARLSGSLRALAGLGLVVVETTVTRDGLQETRTGLGAWSGLLTMHPVVRAATRATMRLDDEPATLVRLVTDLLVAATDDLDAGNATDWPRWAALAPHCFAVLDLLTADPTTAQTPSAALLPPRRAAWYRYMAGLYQQAEADFRAILNVATDVLGEAHPDTLDVRNNLARCIRETGRGGLAEAEFRSVLDVARDHLGDEDPVTINIRINLARTIRESGRSAAAESELRSIVEIARQALGEDHPDTLIAWLNLAVTLREQSRYPEAEADYRAVLAAWRRSFPEEDLTTLDIRYELAETMRQAGSPQAAEDEYRAVLATAETVYGSEHPNTLIIRQGLASALQASGRPEAARAELRQILQHRQARLGAEHPFTKATREVLASLGE
jgi:tetratricopeptide (TPR) repeat protein